MFLISYVLSCFVSSNMFINISVACCVVGGFVQSRNVSKNKSLSQPTIFSVQQSSSALSKQPTQREHVSKGEVGSLTAETTNIDIDLYLPKHSLLTAGNRYSVANAFHLPRDQSEWRPKLSRPMTTTSFLAGSSNTTILRAPSQSTEGYQFKVPASSITLKTAEETNRNSLHVGEFLM